MKLTETSSFSTLMSSNKIDIYERYILYAIFFFAAFFHPLVKLPGVFFTPKHFHVAFLMLLALRLWRRQMLEDIRSGLLQSQAFYPLFGVVMISLVSAGVHQSGMKSILVALNWMLVLSCFVYLSGVLRGHLPILKAGFLCFGLGVVVQVIVGFINNAYELGWFNLQMLHNNHMGALAASSAFYGFTLAITGRAPWHRWMGLFISFFCISGVIFTASRTGMITLLIFSVVFLGNLHFRLSPLPLRRVVFYRLWRGVVLCGLGAFLLLIGTHFFSYFFMRTDSILAFFHGYYWDYAFKDQLNFGFLGRFRWNQFIELASIFPQSPFFGIGLTPMVFGFHNLYFTVLGASGGVGFGLFLYSIFKMLSKATRVFMAMANSLDLIWFAASFSAVGAWLLASFMESLFLQFFPWVHLFGMMLLVNGVHTERTEKPVETLAVLWYWFQLAIFTVGLLAIIYFVWCFLRAVVLTALAPQASWKEIFSFFKHLNVHG